MRNVLTIILILVVGTALHAESPAIKKVELESTKFHSAFIKEGIPTPIYLTINGDQSLTLADFWKSFKEEFQISNDYSFVLMREESDNLGFRHLFYRQSFKGNLIFPAQVHLKLKNKEVVSYSGKSYNNLNESTVKINEREALEVALKDISAVRYKWEDLNEEQHLKQVNQDENATYFPKAQIVYFGSNASYEQSELLLCYKFNIYAQEPLERKNYYINANTGEIVFIENLIHTGDANGQLHTAYSGVRTAVTDSVNQIFRLRETGRGNGIETYDLNNGTSYSNAVDFIDSNNIWDTFNPGIDRYATDAHWGTEATYDYFFNIHNRNSIDNQGFPLRSYVHYSSNYVNAFWDGQRMTYGDGDASTNPLTTLDITGHEIAHGLTNFTSQLIYAKESGALNESFSDIFGVAVDQYARSGSWNWLMGDEIGSAFRNMANPNQYGDPDTYGGLNWVNQNCNPTSGNDWCGVHSNSGVQNFWFYLLSEGKSGVNDLGNSYQVDSIGIIKASKVAFRNNTYYLNASSDFQEARFYSIISAADIYGACSPEVEAVTDAWHAVGVGDPYSPGVSADFVATNDTSFCTLPARVQFESNGSNVFTFNWDFGDGSTSNLAKPTHVYNSFGNYTVSLIADGGSCGSDTIVYPAYINIDSNNVCSFALDTSYLFTNDCYGTFYDNGGLNGAYDFSSTDTLVINSPLADYIKLTINQFDVEAGLNGSCNHDYLEVFDGSSTNDLSLGRYCNANLPPDSIFSASNAVTIVFYSDQKVNNSGFSVSWECRQATARPQVNFSANTDSTCNGEVKFINLSQGGATQYLWSFGDGNFSSDKNPTYTYLQNGVYSVQLRATNSVGSDSLLKSNLIIVDRGVSPQVGNDTVCVNGDATLWASGTPNLLWYNSPLDETPIFNGDTFKLTNLDSSRTYFVSSAPPVSSQLLVPFNISGNGYYTDTTEAIFFNVYEPTVIETVLLKSNSAGIRTIILKDSSGQVINSQEAYLSGSGLQVTLNMEVFPGNNYSLSIGSREPSLYVNSSGASYPYLASGLMEITGSSLGGAGYPFFYFMRVKPLRCESNRTKVEAFVDTNCVITNVNQFGVDAKTTIYPNPATNQIFVSTRSLEQLNSTFVYNLHGELINNLRINRTGNNYKLDISAFSPGIYIIELRGSNNHLSRHKFIKLNR